MMLKQRYSLVITVLMISICSTGPSLFAEQPAEVVLEETSPANPAFSNRTSAQEHAVGEESGGEVKPVKPWFNLSPAPPPARTGSEPIQQAPVPEQGMGLSQPARLQLAAQAGTAMLNFSNVELKDIIRTISEITGENFIIAPGITVKISVQSTKPVPRKDVLGIFESILEVNGLAAVKTGSYYKIVPAQSAKQRSIELYTNTDVKKIPTGDRTLNLVVPVDFISANDLMQILKPLVSPYGSIMNYSKGNVLIITDIASNIKNFLDIIKTLDIDSFERMKISVVPVKNTDAKTLAKELWEIFSALGYGKDTPQFGIIPIERLNSFIVMSSSEELLSSTKEWIERLDVASAAEGTSIHIYYVQNDKASNIKNLLDSMFPGKKGGLPSSSPSTMSQPSSEGSTSSASPVRYDNPGSGSGDGIKIYIYEPNNSLIIQSSQREYQNILNTIRELDKPPKQVLIDALIAEVALDEGTKFGIQWSAIAGNVNVQQNTGIVSATIRDPDGKIFAPIGVTAPSGLTAMATDSRKFFGVVQALASSGKVNVLSNPHIVVKNYEKASINVGSDEPVATRSTQDAVTGTAGLIQNIEYRKTGVILTVSPQITEGGMVAMTIRQEVSDKSTDRIVGNALYPSFTKREAETSVVAKDKETIVIGGLIQERKDKSYSGIPILSRIPLLGWLFRYTTVTDSKTELVILLTPTVMSNPEEAAMVTDEVKNKLEGLKKMFSK